jgi:hypothetical protein
MLRLFGIRADPALLALAGVVAVMIGVVRSAVGLMVLGGALLVWGAGGAIASRGFKRTGRARRHSQW